VTNGLASTCTEGIAAQPEVTYSAVIYLEGLRKIRKNSGRIFVSKLRLRPGTFRIKCRNVTQSVSIRLIQMYIYTSVLIGDIGGKDAHIHKVDAA
jgi:hypothetical protein